MAELLAGVGGGLMMIRPLTGLVVANRAHTAAEALAKAAESNAQLRAVLLRLCEVGAYGGLLFVVGDIVIATGVESQVIPVEHPLAQRLAPEIKIVQDMYEKAARAKPQQQQTVEVGNSQPV